MGLLLRPVLQSPNLRVGRMLLSGCINHPLLAALLDTVPEDSTDEGIFILVC